MKLDRVNHSDFVDGAEIPRVCLSPSNTVATLMKRHFLVAAVLAKPARCRDAELDTFRDASRTHRTPQLVRATDAFFCFSYPKLRPWHLFIDPKSTQLRWMSSLSTQLWRTTSPSCRVAGLPPGYGCRPPTTATLEGGGVDIIVDMPLDRTYPCRLCVFLCVVATCLVCSCRPCFNACIRVQQHHVKNNTIAPQPYIYIYISK